MSRKMLTGVVPVACPSAPAAGRTEKGSDGGFTRALGEAVSAQEDAARAPADAGKKPVSHADTESSDGNRREEKDGPKSDASGVLMALAAWTAGLAQPVSAAQKVPSAPSAPASSVSTPAESEPADAVIPAVSTPESSVPSAGAVPVFDGGPALGSAGEQTASFAVPEEAAGGAAAEDTPVSEAVARRASSWVRARAASTAGAGTEIDSRLAAASTPAPSVSTPALSVSTPAESAPADATAPAIPAVSAGKPADSLRSDIRLTVSDSPAETAASSSPQSAATPFPAVPASEESSRSAAVSVSALRTEPEASEEKPQPAGKGRLAVTPSAGQTAAPAPMSAAGNPSVSGTGGEAQRTVHVAQQIAAALRDDPAGGRTQLRLHLSPEDLGGINLRFTTENGRVTLQITADSSQTGALLSSHIEELNQSLAHSGVVMDRTEVFCQAGSGGQTGGQTGQPWGAPPGPGGHAGTGGRPGGRDAPVFSAPVRQPAPEPVPVPAGRTATGVMSIFA